MNSNHQVSKTRHSGNWRKKVNFQNDGIRGYMYWKRQIQESTAQKMEDVHFSFYNHLTIADDKGKKFS